AVAGGRAADLVYQIAFRAFDRRYWHIPRVQIPNRDELRSARPDDGHASSELPPPTGLTGATRIVNYDNNRGDYDETHETHAATGDDRAVRRARQRTNGKGAPSWPAGDRSAVGERRAIPPRLIDAVG